MKIRPVTPPSPTLGLSDEMRSTLLRRHMASFVKGAFIELNPGTKLIWAPYLDLICAHLEAVAHGQIRRLIILVPPRHLKSICASVALPAYVLGHYPNQEVMCVSYGQDLAKGFGQDCSKLMKSRFYTDLFGEVLPPSRQSPHMFLTRAGGSRRSTSIDGTATGKGADLLIFDDPQKPTETLSDAIRRATNNAYQNTFFTRQNLAPESRIVIVMQRLHEDDFVAHVQSLGEDWTVITLPAIAEEDEAIPYTSALGNSVFRRKAGQPLHPKRMPLEELALQRRALGEAVWATQYMQRPTPAGGGLVKTSWLKRYTPDELPDRFDRIVQSWDTANKIKEWNDYSVCTTWGVKAQHVWLLNVYRARLIFPELKVAVLAQASLHQADIVYIEDHGSGVQILQDLRAQNFGKLRAVHPVGDKKTRMVNQTILMENGFVHVPAAAPWLEDYLHELEMFPNSKWDDQVDSTSQALDNIHSWTAGEGLLEFYRQEAEIQRIGGVDEIWIMKGPPAIGMVTDGEGTEFMRQLDGYFYLRKAHAQRFMARTDWARIR
jgi:predicted phage terminase large subunit-like protein